VYIRTAVRPAGKSAEPCGPAGLGIGNTDVFDLGGILSALIGVVLVLLVGGVVMRRGRSASRPHTST
jgi:hypothetical protein